MKIELKDVPFGWAVALPMDRVSEEILESIVHCPDQYDDPDRIISSPTNDVVVLTHRRVSKLADLLKELLFVPRNEEEETFFRDLFNCIEHEMMFSTPEWGEISADGMPF